MPAARWAQGTVQNPTGTAPVCAVCLSTPYGTYNCSTCGKWPKGVNLLPSRTTTGAAWRNYPLLWRCSGNVRRSTRPSGNAAVDLHQHVSEWPNYTSGADKQRQNNNSFQTQNEDTIIQSAKSQTWLPRLLTCCSLPAKIVQ